MENILSNRDELMTRTSYAVKLGAMTPLQCRAARVFLNWEQTHLAQMASVGVSTVIDFEKSRRVISAEKVQDIRLALENAGIMFLNDLGVALRRRT